MKLFVKFKNKSDITDSDTSSDIEQPIQEKSKSTYNKQTIVSKEVNKKFTRLELFLKDKIKYLNKESDNFFISCNFIDKTHDIVEVNSNFLNFLEHKINSFENSNFKNYLLNFFYELNIQYSNFTYLADYIKFQQSLNDLFYLTLFYSKINK
jgi:hypothetical protein